ncbi:hypothetical protein RRG08_048596 [Elysia crispata]|uniref:Uncharacterized protein n=1 Tax=Elysia crispata TaxID=231223 RepID=A0AAE1DWZ9_9GAST|nr:hypothetical protein RRG08_048596 [Elysia crispata]
MRDFSDEIVTALWRRNVSLGIYNYFRIKRRLSESEESCCSRKSLPPPINPVTLRSVWTVSTMTAAAGQVSENHSRFPKES